MILHITTHKEWEKAQAEGAYMAPSLKKEGFIHCSTSEQAIDTANHIFKGQHGLAILCIDETRLTSKLIYEKPISVGQHKPSNDKLFPHIYGAINLAAVIKVVDFPANEEGFFVLPQEIIL
ncbi:MAG: hypothetical protein AUJ97_02060 [Bacteroidetes bacterium CG2_30_32_10]|nr:MAG: hypothetical protein AUJ97_02060 [Bacteroidetes bacterium CG2_30_32_10]